MVYSFSGAGAARRVPSFLRRTILTIGGLVIVKDYVGEFALCKGPSMEPTIGKSGEILLIDKITPWLPMSTKKSDKAQESNGEKDQMLGIKRGDIVIATSPIDPDKLLCKRVVAIEGDIVFGDSFKSTILCYIGLGSYIRIPQGHIWLQGDNNENSRDSRTFGPVPFGLIRGRAICKLWPPNQFLNKF